MNSPNKRYRLRGRTSAEEEKASQPVMDDERKRLQAEIMHALEVTRPRSGSYTEELDRLRGIDAALSRQSARNDQLAAALGEAVTSDWQRRVGEGIREYLQRIAPGFVLISRADYERLSADAGRHRQENETPNVRGTSVDRLIVLGTHMGQHVSERMSQQGYVYYHRTPAIGAADFHLPSRAFNTMNEMSQTRHVYCRMSFRGPNDADWGCVFFEEGSNPRDVERATWECLRNTHLRRGDL